MSKPRDIKRGAEVFAKQCLDCHKLNEEDHDIGPKLGTNINKLEETILLDLLDPSGRIEPEYRSYIVLTNDGRLFTGVLASESATSVTLRKEKGISESILRADIDIMNASSVSLMPSNLHEQVSPQELGPQFHPKGDPTVQDASGHLRLFDRGHSRKTQNMISGQTDDGGRFSRLRTIEANVTKSCDAVTDRPLHQISLTI